MAEETKPVEEKKKKVSEGKKPHKNKPTSQKYKMYKILGDKIVRNKGCPRCGAGIFLAEDKNRFFCGKCKYTEFKGK